MSNPKPVAQVTSLTRSACSSYDWNLNAGAFCPKDGHSDPASPQLIKASRHACNTIFTRSPPPDYGWGAMIAVRQSTEGIRPFPNLGAVRTSTRQLVLRRSHRRTRLSAGGGTNREFQPLNFSIHSKTSASVAYPPAY